MAGSRPSRPTFPSPHLPGSCGLRAPPTPSYIRPLEWKQSITAEVPVVLRTPSSLPHAPFSGWSIQSILDLTCRPLCLGSVPKTHLLTPTKPKPAAVMAVNTLLGNSDLLFPLSPPGTKPDCSPSAWQAARKASKWYCAFRWCSVLLQAPEQVLIRSLVRLQWENEAEVFVSVYSLRN